MSFSANKVHKASEISISTAIEYSKQQNFNRKHLVLEIVSLRKDCSQKISEISEKDTGSELKNT
jgi:hypothetical protein